MLLSTNPIALAETAVDSRIDRHDRRQQVKAACKPCRIRKGKCDGHRPCRWCRDHEGVCEYEVEAGETRTQAIKRRYEDLSREHLALLEIIDIAALRPDAGDILRQLKSGMKINDLLGSLKEAKDIDEVEDKHIGRGAPQHVHCHSRSGCDVLEDRAVECGRDVTGQGDVGNSDEAGRRMSRHSYPEIVWQEPAYS